MTSSLHKLFEALLFRWLDTGEAPDAAAEGVTPEFAALLGAQPADFTFDELVHAAPAPFLVPALPRRRARLRV